jgi:hypothetical protein
VKTTETICVLFLKTKNWSGFQGPGYIRIITEGHVKIVEFVKIVEDVEVVKIEKRGCGGSMALGFIHTSLDSDHGRPEKQHQHVVGNVKGGSVKSMGARGAITLPVACTHLPVSGIYAVV